MKDYFVLYRIESVMSPLDHPFGFHCLAEDTDHADEQCLDVYPDCQVVWVVEDCDNMNEALETYYYENLD
jgi:hypothetical protein